MKSFNKILSLVLTLTMLVSFVAMPTAFAAIKYPVGDTSNYEVAATFVNANEGDLESAEAGSTVYLKLELKNISTLNTGYVAVTLEGATFVAETSKLNNAIFSKDSDTSEFVAGSTYASYGLVTDTANLTSINKKVKYHAFAAPTDMYLALYEVKINEDATEVAATVSQNLKLGDANGATGNIAATAEGIKLTNDTLAIGGGDDPVPPTPVITYSYAASWNGLTTTAKTFAENTTEDEIKAEVVVEKLTYTDGAYTGKDVMTSGYRVVLNDGVVTVTIDGEFDANVVCDLTYTIDAHVPVVTYDYDVEWNTTPEFMYGVSDAFIKSCIKVTKYTFEDGVKVNTEVITEGYTVALDNGVATVTIGDKSINRAYTILDKVEYKNAKLIADDKYEYSLTETDIAELISVTVEKWVNDAKDDDITLEQGTDYKLDITFDQNYNDGRIEVEFIGDYINLTNPQSVVFERINPTVTYEDVVAYLTETEFAESATEAEIAATVVVTAKKVVGNLAGVDVTFVNGVDYNAIVEIETSKVIIDFITIQRDDEELPFTIIPAVITYKNASAGLSDSVFGNVPTAEEIIARLSVKAEKYKDDVFSDVVQISSENYDLTINDGEVIISFKGAYAALEDITVEYTVEEVAYGDPVVVVDGIISADGKSVAEIEEEAWTLITATRDILTNGIVTGSENLDKEALEALGVAANYAEGKVTFVYNDAVIAEVSVSLGKLQFGSNDPRTSATEFIKYVGATLKNIFDKLMIKKDVFQIIVLNDEAEWETVSEAIANGDAVVTVDGVTYDASNLDSAATVVVGDDENKVIDIEYKDVVQTVEVSLLDVPSDYANENGETPVVSITTDATQVQTGTTVNATVYVSGLVGNIETGKVSLLYSNAVADVDDIVAENGFEILSKTVSGNEITVVFTINDAAYDAGAGIFTVEFDTTDSDVNAKLGLAISDYALTRIVDMNGYKEYKPVNASIGSNVEVTVTAGDVIGYEYEVSYKSGKTTFYTADEAVADVKVLAYTTTNGVRDENQTPVDVTAESSINANNGVITVDKDGIRVTTLTYSIYEVAFEQFVAIETIGSVDDAKFVDNTSVSLDGADVDGAVIALDGRSIKVAVAGIKAEGTYKVEVAVPGYTKATINVVVAKKATRDGYDATVVTGSKIYAGDINGDNRIDGVDFSDVAGMYGQNKEAKYDLYTGNDSATIDNLDVTTMAHYFITLARGLVSEDGTRIIPYQ